MASLMAPFLKPVIALGVHPQAIPLQAFCRTFRGFPSVRMCRSLRPLRAVDGGLCTSCRFHDYKALHPSGVRCLPRGKPDPLLSLAPSGFFTLCRVGHRYQCLPLLPLDPRLRAGLDFSGLFRVTRVSALPCGFRTFTLLGVRPPGISPVVPFSAASGRFPIPF